MWPNFASFKGAHLMLRKLKIGKRLSLAFALITLITLVVGLTAVFQFKSTQSDIINLAERRIPASLLAGEMNRDFLFIRLYSLRLLSAESTADRQRYLERIRTEQSNYQKIAEQMALFHQSPAGRAVFDKVVMAKQQYDSAHQELLKLIEQERFQEANALVNLQINDRAANVTSSLNELAAYQQQTTESRSNQAMANISSATTGMISIIILSIFGSAALAYFFSRSLVTPMQNAVAISQRIASGDLTQHFSDNEPDEAGDMIRSMAEMQTQLRETLAQISLSSSQLAATSEELSVVTEQSSRVLHQQSQELELAATAVTELTTAIEEVASSAAATSRDSATADAKALQGKERVLNTINTVGVLENELQAARQGIQKLAGRVNEITSVLDVIRGIAEQTNLLALNAAIEAARAGETGRGFAVVADEVRALAHRTQESTKEIERMMQAVQSETQSTVNTMQASSERATETLKIAQQAGEALEVIASAITQINDQNLTIASAAEEQATVAREVDSNLVNIRDLSQQTSEGAHETQASSAELARLAETLNTLVTKFKV